METGSKQISIINARGTPSGASWQVPDVMIIFIVVLHSWRDGRISQG